MATLYWLGTADAVAQVDTATPANPNTNDIYYLKINAETIASFTVGATETVQAVVDGLIASWNASEDPRAEVITATDEGDSKVTLTSDVEGMPFVVTSAIFDGGGGAAPTLTMATTTSSAGPHHWDTALNWSTGAVPVNADDVIIADSDVSILWGLANSGVALSDLVIQQTFTGKIGLDRTVFATSADGTSHTDEKTEYRQHYLDISWDRCDIGEHYGPGAAAGSRRLKLDNSKAGASTTYIHNTATQASEANLPAVRLVYANVGAEVYIYNGPGGVGMGVDAPNEASTIGKISIAGASANTNVYMGSGVSLTTWEQDSGVNFLDGVLKNGLTTLTCDGGTVTVAPNVGVITTLNVSGGTAYINNIGAAAAVTTANLTGGTTDLTQFTAARTWTTVNISESATLKADGSVLTITTLNEPTSGRYTLTCTN